VLLLRWLTLRSMRVRPGRLVLSLFGIVLGVAGILAIGATNQTALQAVTKLFQNTSGKANLVIVSAGGDNNRLSESVLNRVRLQPGIAAAAPSLHLQTALAAAQQNGGVELSFFGASAGGLMLYGIDPTLDRAVRDYTIVSGRFLSDDLDATETVLVEDYAQQNKIEVGQDLRLLTGSGVQSLRVVGLMAKSGAGQLNNGVFGVLPLRRAQKLFYREGKLDQVDIVAQAPDNPDAIDQFKVDLQSRLGTAVSVTYPASQGKRMTQMLGNYQIGLNFMSGMALFVGAFLIYNAFSMTVVERTREFGMLRTVGMTQRQVMNQVLGEAFFLGVLGSGLGVGLGLLMANGLTRLMETLLAQKMSQIEVPLQLLITSTSVGLVVTIAAAMLPALQAGRISPLDALRVRGAVQDSWLTRRGWIGGAALIAVSTGALILNPFPYDVQYRLGSMAVFGLFTGGTLMIPVTVGFWQRWMRPLMGLIYGSAGRIGAGNVERARLRTTLTAAALMVGVAMIVIVWAMTGSFKSDLDEWLKGYLGGDLFVTSSLPMRPEVWRRVEGVPGVQAVTPVRYFEAEWLPPGRSKEKISLTAIDPATHRLVTSLVFTKDGVPPAQALAEMAGGDALLISSVVAEKYGLRPGDQVSLLARTGPVRLRVAGVIVDYYNQGMTLTVGWGDMVRLFRNTDANALLIKAAAGYSPSQVKEAIKTAYGDRYQLVIESNQAVLGKISGLMDQAFSMFDVLAVISMLVAFLGITNTLTMNVMERTREIGMLRGVGMTRPQVIRMIVSEAGLIGVIGGLLGVAFGAALSRLMMAAMTVMSGYRLEYQLSTGRILAAFITAFVVANLAALLPAMRAARIQILEAIQYE
jgi:putative ABC transport system permease protein